MSDELLTIENVKTHFPVYRGFVFRRRVGTVKAVDDVTLHVRRGEVLGLVGESGCGKSTLARTIIQLIRPTEGRVIIDGRDLATLSPEELRQIRGQIQMVFQDPYASLNPRMTVFDTLAEPLLTHGIVTRPNAPAEVARLMELVGLAPRFMRKYPHEFSGGQRQRIAVARALALRPKLLIADEPVSALDVSIQAQILNLLAKLTRDLGLSMVFIAHDLSVVKHISDRIAVMYLGKIVEIGEASEIIDRPRHPYTRALISAIPVPDPEKERSRLRIILGGEPPSPMNPPVGCSFHPRCRFATDICHTNEPPLEQLRDGRRAACIRVEEID